MDIILCLPALFYGMPFSKIFTVYMDQTQAYKYRLTLNFPNIYNLIGNANRDIFYNVGTLAVIIICFLILIYIINKKVKWDNEKIITLALWFIFMVTYILPGMHERYLYIAEVLVVIYYLLYRKNLPVLIFLILSPILTYSSFLNGLVIDNMQLISITYGVILIFFTKSTLELLANNKKTSN